MFCFVVCPFLFKDIRKAIELSGYDNIRVFAYTAKCSGMIHTKYEIEQALPSNVDYSHVVLMGNQCIDNKNIPEGWHFQHQNLCFSALANKEIMDSYIQEGNYLLTAGWLAGWKARMHEMGFDYNKDSEIAQLFFSEMAHQLLYLDTENDESGSAHLKEFAAFVKLPYKTLRIGLDFLQLTLTKYFLDWKLKNEKKLSEEALQSSLQESSNYAMVLDVFSSLTLFTNEDDVIDRILNLFKMLFSPQLLGLLPIKEGKPETMKFHSQPSGDLSDIECQVKKLSQEYDWTDSGSGFLLRISHCDEVLGVLFIDGISFPDYKGKYLNLAMSLVSVCGLAIDNTRKFVQITSQRNHLSTTLQKLESSQKQLVESRKMESIGQLAGGVAHDFNNVLSGIMSAAQLLQQPRRQLDEKSLKYVNIILQSSHRAADLIGKLLAFGRKGQYAITKIDLHDILDDSIEILRNTLDKKISIKLLNEAERVNVSGDRSEIESAFMNLFINASHAMVEGGAIQIRSENMHLDKSYCDSSLFEIEPGEYCQICVRDSGSGIAPENLDKIFEPFFTTKEQGQGTGLGLSAVYGTIQDHHGEIKVQSQVGVGTSFFILLPYIDILTEEVLKIEKVQNGIGTILFVDDEETNRILGSEILESLGYSVIVAQNGLESLEIFKLKYSEIDIVIMDMIMPIMNGSETFIKMKEIDENCKIIISTGHFKNENITKLLAEGLVGYIRKPYEISEISQLLHKFSC